MRPETALWIFEQTNLRDVFTARSRDADRAIVADVLDLVRLATNPATDFGRTQAADIPRTGALESPGRLLSVREAAGVIGISPRAVRLAVTRKNNPLPSQVVGGIHVIDERDAHQYKAKGRRAA